MLKPHLRNGLCHAFRLMGVKEVRTTRFHIAKSASAGADFAQNHDGRVLFRPAFANIGASCFFTNGVELLLTHKFARFVIFLGNRGFDPNPIWLFQSCLRSHRHNTNPLLKYAGPGHRRLRLTRASSQIMWGEERPYA